MSFEPFRSLCQRRSIKKEFLFTILRNELIIFIAWGEKWGVSKGFGGITGFSGEGSGDQSSPTEYKGGTKEN